MGRLFSEPREEMRRTALELPSERFTTNQIGLAAALVAEVLALDPRRPRPCRSNFSPRQLVERSGYNSTKNEEVIVA